jgi:hypothetical protein
MNGTAQIQMFEPEGAKLAELVQVHNRTSTFERRICRNLIIAGYHSAALSRLQIAEDADRSAATCECALLFERLAGLS